MVVEGGKVYLRAQPENCVIIFYANFETRNMLSS